MLLRVLMSFGLGVFTLTALHTQIWNAVNKNNLPSKGERTLQVNEFLTYTINDSEIKSLLWSAPNENSLINTQSNCILSVPLKSGEIDQFKIVEFDMMEPELKNKFPDIKTFHGISLSIPSRRIRADYSVHGFRAVIYDESGNSYIDHYTRGNKSIKIVYGKESVISDNFWTCDFENEESNIDHRVIENRVGTCIFRTYRLAVATTAEYSNYHGATSVAQVDSVMSEVVVAMNRVNGVLESDLAVRFILVANTDQIFYYVASTDPYSNGNGSAMLGQNQTTCDNVIGNGNYDIGHVFSTGGGGVAYLGCICNNSNKAGGVTGQPNPVGDPFTIDYVAHEMGHQLGGNHTQNNSCNRNNATAVEPGSASTIMGYAGICNPNVQSNSDAYYHAVNLAEIENRLANTSSCYQTISTFNNTAPVLDPLTNYSIPKSTPFVLTASATDANGDPITYCWEQTNTGNAPMPPASTNTTGPTFRSKNPTTSPIRYLPPLANVLDNSSNTWEVLPSVARTLNFRVTARDYHVIGGCTHERNMTVTIAGSGPFEVSSFNAAPVSFEEGSNVNVTWAVANTTSSPVNCSSVNILLSTDGGNTFPMTLATATANDGTHTVTIPIGSTTGQGRIMVKASNNIFYDINNTNINITPSPVNFNMIVNPQSLNICNNAPNAIVNIDIVPLSGFNLPVTLTTENLPSGIVASFSSNPVLPNQSSVLTLTSFSGLSGNYNFNIKGTASSLIKTSSIGLNVSVPLTAPTLTSPANNSSNVGHLPVLAWSVVNGAATYEYQLSQDQNFSFNTAEGIIPDNGIVLSTPLSGQATYFWRVRAGGNCANPWSTVFSFSTNDCFYFANNQSSNIGSGAPSTVFNNITIYDRGTLSTLEIKNLEGTHTYVDNLKFSLISPTNLELLIWDRPCNDEDNFDINFSDSAASSNHPCPPADGLTYLPANSLGVFSTNSLKGNWKMKVEDLVQNDGGVLNKWAVLGCFTKFCKLYVDQPLNNGMGSLYNAYTCHNGGDTIRFSSAIKNTTVDMGNVSLYFDKNVSLVANPADSITIQSSASNPTIVIAPGITVTIEGLTILGSQSNVAVIQNNGNLILRNTNLRKNINNNPPVLLLNQGLGSTLIQGSCNIRE